MKLRINEDLILIMGVMVLVLITGIVHFGFWKCLGLAIKWLF